MGQFVNKTFAVLVNSFDCELDRVEIKPDIQEAFGLGSLIVSKAATWILEPGDTIKIVDAETEIV